MTAEPGSHLVHYPGFPSGGSADNTQNARPADAGSGQERARLPVLVGLPTITGKVLEGGLEPVLEGPEAEAHKAGYEWLLRYRENESTARSYAWNLEAWFTFCRGFDVDPLEAPRQLLERYKASLFDRGLKPSTVNQRLSALSSFYSYCDDEDLLPARNPMRTVRRPKVPNVSMSTGLTREELNDFLAEAKRRGPMMNALMMLLAMNGLRASEPLGSTVDDVGTMRGHATLAIERKGAKGSKVKVPLAPVTATALEDWMTERASLLGQGGRGTGPLFFAFRRGSGEVQSLERTAVWRWVRAIGAKAVPANPSLHPHDLRHAFVTLSLDSGVSLRDVRDAAGHASADTTSRYDRNRHNMDRHATYSLAGYLAGSTST